MTVAVLSGTARERVIQAACTLGLWLGAAACAGAGAGAGKREAPSAWTVLLDAERLTDWKATAFGGEGDVIVEDDLIVLEMGSPLTGLSWTGGELPRWDYELEVTARRLAGTDFFCGLTFPVGESHATLILGGWGGALTGLSCIDGADASENETTTFIAYERGREVSARVRVTRAEISTWLDGELLHTVGLVGHTVGLRPEVLLSRPLGVASFLARSGLRDLRLRRVGAD
ncbi:MAG: DUF1080 domain-containing protein [Planctomycetota bacterium]|nr:DUF1080 domain-containing protein [Planctomycetota bacterium]